MGNETKGWSSKGRAGIQLFVNSVSNPKHASKRISQSWMNPIGSRDKLGFRRLSLSAFQKQDFDLGVTKVV
jgi:hypothetical protein